MKKIKKWDKVIVIAWKNKWKVSDILKVDWDNVYLDWINVYKKAQKWKWYEDKILPIHISNVMYYDEKNKKWTKISISVLKDWKKQRIMKSTNESIKD